MRVTWFALAAALLLAVGLWWATKSNGPIALAYAGRLSDFGYEPGGIVARDAQDAARGNRAKRTLEQLQRADSGDVGMLLNRGHAWLTLGRLERAQADFDAAIKLAPANALAWLGRGLAHFMLDLPRRRRHSFFGLFIGRVQQCG